MTGSSNASRKRRRPERPVQPRAPYVTRAIGPLPVLSEEGLELIETNADRILAETGMEFHDDPEILKVFREAGCDVDGVRVRFEPGFCRKIIQSTAPAEFSQQARNLKNIVHMGGFVAQII